MITKPEFTELSASDNLSYMISESGMKGKRPLHLMSEIKCPAPDTSLHYITDVLPIVLIWRAPEVFFWSMKSITWRKCVDEFIQLSILSCPNSFSLDKFLNKTKSLALDDLLDNEYLTYLNYNNKSSSFLNRLILHIRIIILICLFFWNLLIKMQI